MHKIRQGAFLLYSNHCYTWHSICDFVVARPTVSRSEERTIISSILNQLVLTVEQKIEQSQFIVV